MSTSQDEIGSITTEVMEAINTRGVSLNRAVAWSLHRRGIYHSDERERYNLFFQQIRERYKNRDRQALKKAMRGDRSWQHGKIVRDHPPAKGKFYKSDPWETADPNNAFWEDNIGYVHTDQESLHEAPC